MLLGPQLSPSNLYVAFIYYCPITNNCILNSSEHPLLTLQLSVPGVWTEPLRVPHGAINMRMTGGVPWRLSWRNC